MVGVGDGEVDERVGVARDRVRTDDLVEPSQRHPDPAGRHLSVAEQLDEGRRPAPDGGRVEHGAHVDDALRAEPVDATLRRRGREADPLPHLAEAHAAVLGQARNDVAVDVVETQQITSICHRSGPLCLASGP